MYDQFSYMARHFLLVFLVVVFVSITIDILSTSSLNAATPASISPPIDWHVGEFERGTNKWIGGDKSRNIKWASQLGSVSYSTPRLADGKIIVGTNNATGYIANYPPQKDLGVIIAFDANDGSFRWQYSSEKLNDGVLDWAEQGICSNPAFCSKTNRLFFVSNRCEVVCVSADQNSHDASPIWTFDMIKENGVIPHNMTSCSPVLVDLDNDGNSDIVVTGTSNGVAANDRDIANSEAPCVIALDIETGKLVWSVNLAGENILDGQWGSPAIFRNTVRNAAENASKSQDTLIFFPGGDGWIYYAEITDEHSHLPKSRSMYPLSDLLPDQALPDPSLPKQLLQDPLLREQKTNPKPEQIANNKSFHKQLRIVAKFDCNPKNSVWKGHGRGDRNTLIATPVVAENRLFIATGQDPESGEGPAILSCLNIKLLQIILLEYADEIESGNILDVSDVIVVDTEGKSVSPRRFCAIDESAGEKIVPNPNSILDWKYEGRDTKSTQFEDLFRRTIGSAAVEKGFVLIGDLAGVLHCLEVKTGRLCWTFDTMGPIWGTPLAVYGKFYIGNTNGDLFIFEADEKCNKIAEIAMKDAIYGAPVFDGQTLYIATAKYIFAVTTSITTSNNND
ncbi:MAG: PQQ-binding-like beta-propeller repeat protein [Thermoguttaceae bacterium]